MGRPRPNAPRKQTYELAILLLPNFSQVCLSSIVEPLRLANALSRRDLFRWRLVGPSGNTVECAGAIPIGVANDFEAELGAIRSGKMPDAAIVCAGDEVEQLCSSAAISLVRLYAKRGATLFGSNTGTWLLARAGLLGGKNCTIHWHKAVALSERFDDLMVETALFVKDGTVVTCSGGFAAFDMMIDTIAAEFGFELARTICRYMNTDHTRDGSSGPAMPASLRLSDTSAKLIGAIRLMEGNLEHPIPMDIIAGKVGTSRRQLERLFHRYLSATPSRHYLNLRLSRARQLLDSTNFRVLEIAIACGFESPSHFSKSFRERFGEAPNSVRAFARAL